MISQYINTKAVIDIGATYIRFGKGEENGTFLLKKKVKTEKRSVRNFLEQLKKICEFLGSKEICIASVGPLRNGCIVNSPNLFPKKKIRIKHYLKKFSFKIKLVNDCNAGVLAEKFYGKGKNYENLVFISFGSGIGCGAIINNKLILGKDGNACEAGHMVIDKDFTLRCHCGGYGHWEAYCGGDSLPRFFKIWSKKKKKFEAKEIFDSAKNGRKPFIDFIKIIGKFNAIGIANLVNLFDPEILIIGGSLALKNKWFFKKFVFPEIKKYSINRLPIISFTKLGEWICLKGALAYSFKF